MKGLKKIDFQQHPILLLSLLTCFAFFVRYFFAFQELAYLDRLFIPDDAYYILSISRSMVAGLGPSVDGVQLTNGFQPLISFFQTAIFLLGFKGDQAVSLAVYLTAFWGGISTFVLGYLLMILSSIRAAFFGSVLWIFCPIIIQNDLNGMETSLAGFLNLLTILLVLLIDKKLTYLRLLILGVICGLAYLARADSCFLLIVIGLFALLRWGFHASLFFVAIAVLVVLPWWIYSYAHFATIIPESVQAIKQLVNYIHRSTQFNTLASLYSLIEWFPFFKCLALTACLGIIITFYIIAKGACRAGLMAYILVPSIALQWIFYTFYLPAFWFFTRYYYFIYSVILILLALLLDAKKDSQAQRRSLAFLLLILLAFCIYLSQFLGKPQRTKAADISSLKGYRDVALELIAHLAPGDRIGAFQSGALSYYAPASVRVINLDGVVNAEAAKAFKTKTMKNYVDSQHMNRFADWEYNAYLFKDLYGAPFPAGCFNTIYETQKQGSQRFTLRNYNPKCKFQ
ncbi:hypothetical protein Lnau_0856 [Legionella nautarum]|uniref:Glycosyltransferase RgtA/B/C/D-like domain-containing protein n=1 Tax=Legionella nautarum TaxID=45070 RepID=A0A0W0WU80_9GAMM|nr:hypothetical protein [Legionella nautarum]KTD35872.1 hypothetical protein Lnau_0856 [Legionella nautarum]